MPGKPVTTTVTLVGDALTRRTVENEIVPPVGVRLSEIEKAVFEPLRLRDVQFDAVTAMVPDWPAGLSDVADGFNVMLHGGVGPAACSTVM